MKNIIAASVFLIIGFLLVDSVPSREIALVCSILILTIYLFVFEIVRVDVAAICIMVLLGLSGFIASWFGLAAELVPAEPGKSSRQDLRSEKVSGRQANIRPYVKPVLYMV